MSGHRSEIGLADRIDTQTDGDASGRTLPIRCPIFLGSVALVAGVVSFFVGSAIYIAFGGTPPSSTPVVSIVGHGAWFLAVAFLAIGTLTLLYGHDGVDPGLAGHVATGTFGLGVLAGLQWVIWAWVDVLAADNEGYEVLLEAVISPYGSALALAYGTLVAAGIAFLGWETRRRRLVHRYVGWTGVAIGLVGILDAGAVLLSAGKNALFAGLVLVMPLFYVWILVLAVGVYRRHAVTDDPEMDAARLRQWLDGYRQAWVEADPDAAGQLFSEDAEYHRTPFETIEGRDAIVDYWQRATASQRDTRVTVEPLATAGDAGFGRFVATYTDESGTDVEIDGICTVELDDESGRCREFREWWHRTPRVEGA